MCQPEPAIGLAGAGVEGNRPNGSFSTGRVDHDVDVCAIDHLAAPPARVDVVPRGAAPLLSSAIGEEIGDTLLELTESQWFERKSGRVSAKKAAETAIAFANAEGGCGLSSPHAKSVRLHRHHDSMYACAVTHRRDGTVGTS